jgi:hypothetical protein
LWKNRKTESYKFNELYGHKLIKNKLCDRATLNPIFRSVVPKTPNTAYEQKAKSSHSATAKRRQIFPTFSVSFASQLRRMVLIKSIKLRLSLEKLGRSFLPKPAKFPHSLTSVVYLQAECPHRREYV